MNNKAKRIGGIIMNVVTYLFLAICILSVILTIFSRKDPDGTSEIFGYQMRLVTTDSMGKHPDTDVSDCDIGSIPQNSMIFIEMVPEDPEEATEWYRDLKPGDVLTFKYVYTTQVTITHRIKTIDEPSEGRFIIELEGDNKASEEQLTQKIDTGVPNNMNYVIGRVTAKAFLPGLLLTLLKTPVGLVLMVIVPCAIIIILELIKIFSALNAEKKQKYLEETAKRESELEELKRRLAELESSKNNGEGGDE